MHALLCFSLFIRDAETTGVSAIWALERLSTLAIHNVVGARKLGSARIHFSISELRPLCRDLHVESPGQELAVLGRCRSHLLLQEEPMLTPCWVSKR